MMNKDNRNDKIRKIAKKGLTLSLCAVLAGGLAAGSFEGVNKLAGWSGATTVEAASNKDETTLTYAKSEKKDADTSDSKSDTGKDTGSTAKGNLDVSEIASEALPSIVSITTKSVQEVQNYFGMYGMYGYAPQLLRNVWNVWICATQQEQEVEGSGSGIIVGKNDDELLIATNYHVVEGADTLSVAFTDGNAVEASVKGFDEERDLAVVSVSLDDVEDDTMDAISIANIGSSDDLKVGEQVVAIGNALGYGQSVTTGIVSAKNRRMDSDNNTVTDGSDDSSDGVNLIQTDAAINPGNSGGALLNMEGEVVGINSAKLASTEVEGMGYAIAISDVTDILQNLMNETSRDKLDDSEHGVLGIEGSSVSSEAVQMYGIPAGVFVKKVTEGGAADKAGLKANSVITEFNGKTVSSIDQLSEYLSYYEPDEEVELTVQVPHGTSYKEETVKVTLDENTDADDSDDNDKDSKKSKKDSKKSSKDADEDVDEDTDSEDSMDSDDTEESENPFIQYFENQGFFR
ncbi:MAG: serine protease HtrA [Clostridiales bacterium Nov_37_41]|nr:MAG: serine protease HtrA [Clostridiales bacterium Nov_37_41]